DASMLPGSVPEVPAAVLAALPEDGSLAAGTFVKGSQGAGVYALAGGARRAVSSWADLVALAGGAPSIVTVDQRLVDLLPVGPAMLGPGSLVVAPRSAAVYFVNGRSELVPVLSFATTGELGALRLVRVADADLDAYAVRSAPIGTAVDCGGVRFLGLGGKLYEVPAAVAAEYRLAFTPLEAAACANLPRAAVPLDRFLRDAGGGIYHVEGGVKRLIRSWNDYLALGGTASNTIAASAYALSLIPTGPPR
ncbi:hypothetical protein, partial [Geodermatophilus sp. SYSU D00815]